MIKGLERKIEALKESYESELRTIRNLMKDERDIQSLGFEKNMIAHLVEMNSVKMRMMELRQIVELIKMQEDA
jgi:hypothetical protein